MFEDYKISTSALDLWIKTKKIHDNVLDWLDLKYKAESLIKNYPHNEAHQKALKKINKHIEELSKELKQLQM